MLTTLAEFPHLQRLHQEFSDNHKLWKSSIMRGAELFGTRWCEEFDGLLATMMPDDASIGHAAKGYGCFSLDAMRRQKDFEVSREYPNKTYAQAASEVYFNERHMMEEYLPGLLLSHFLWPHHYRQLQFFDSAFVAPMALRGARLFSEVGVGTGLYSRRIFEKVAGIQGTGFDISPSSCRFASRHMASIGTGANYTLHEQNVLDNPIPQVEWLVCVEVLEHLEDPVTFLRTLREALTPGGCAFITAALNAGHTDHIYLYRTPQEVWIHLEEAGFVLQQAFSAAAYPPPAPGVPVPMAAAFVVTL